MATDMFMKFTPELKGESRDKEHKDQVDVLAWSWGASNSGSAHIGGGAGTGKVSVQDLSFTKYLDVASTELLHNVCVGKHFDSATLFCRKAGGDEKPLTYLTITMTEVFVSSYSTGGSGGEDKLTENVTLNFAKFKIDYVQQSEKGGKGASPTFTFNIAENAKE